DRRLRLIRLVTRRKCHGAVVAAHGNGAYFLLMAQDATDNRAKQEAEKPQSAGSPRPSPSPAAKRALEEAAARRRERTASERPPEIPDRGGLDPVRYGDWEKNGIASDF